MIKEFKNQALDYLWRDKLKHLPVWKRWLLWSGRMVVVLGRELAQGELTLRAMSLVYTTLLALVPLLAVSFSVLKGFGVHNQIEPLLLNLLAPLGEKGIEITERVIGFVENMKVGVLGAVGMAMLLYTVISLIQKIESAFNRVWRVQGVRSISRRFSDYLSVIFVAPMLMFSAIGMTASVMSNTMVQKLIAIEPFGSLILVFSKMMPWFLIVGAFTFIYMFVPNIKVRFRSALIGGIIGGILWQMSGWVFASFAAGSTRYAAIYSSFAILLLLLIWLYVCWFVVLFGAQVAYFHQHPYEVRREREEFRFSNRLKEQITLMIMALTTRSYINGEKGMEADHLAEELPISQDEVVNVIVDLEKLGLLLETGDDPPHYIPARDPADMTVAEVLDTIRNCGHQLSSRELESLGVVNSILSDAEEASRKVVADMDIKTLASKL